MTRITAAAALGSATLALGIAGGASATNILQNPGFESGALSPWFIGNNYGGGPWTVTNAISHSGVYSATDFGNVELRQNFAGVLDSKISQVSFYIEDTAGLNAYNFYYSDGSTTEFTVRPSVESFSFFDVTSNLAAGKTLTGFSIYGNSGGTTHLDDLTIAAAVPEPAAWALMLAGFAGLGAALRGRRRGVASA